MLVIFLTFLITATFLYYGLIKPVTYWQRHGVKQLSAYEIWKRNLMMLIQQQPVAELFQELYNLFPGVRYSGIYQFLDKSLIIKDVDLIKKITIKDFDHFANHKSISPGEVLWEKNLFSLKDEKWKNMRNILSPSFTSSKMKMMFNLVADCADQFVNYFEEKMQNSSCVSVEMKDASTRFANDVIASTAFGITCDSLTHPNNEFYMMGRKITPQVGFWKTVQLIIIFNLPILAKICGLRYLSKTASKYFFKVIQKTLRDRERKKIVRYDMIHLMMEARKQSKEKLSDVDITAQALLFFFGGFDTISTLVSFMTHELAVNVDVQKRLRKEIEETLKECNGMINYDALFNMKYLDMVVNETLRKWPSGIVTDRVCSKPYEIVPEKPGEVSVFLQKGDVVWIPFFGLHRDPKLFPNPERFDPERFSEENKSNFNANAYIPFGFGPRACIANRYALMEVKLFFFKLLSKFDIVVVDKTVVPLKLANVSFQMTAEGGFWVGLQSRVK
ncbi:hypothetical protein FQR65_LT01431 [Abscondita terminalis]|nr:hypothetical protein FQR65_LT01431 [Abscondita terminalis]